ncbi:MAG: LysO family transporter [Clostridia bacterium]|nr:LysO family transporter [Clostridia bacterium]
MIYYLVFIAIGWIIGYLDIIPNNMGEGISKAQFICLLFILFIMGLKIGLDATIINSWDSIGFKAFVLACGSILGSLFLTRIVAKNFFYNKWGDTSDIEDNSISDFRSLDR